MTALAAAPASDAPVLRAHGTTVDALVQEILALIRERGLGVGQSLPTERDLGEHFGASRNTVREALRTLKAYGLIDVRPKVGAIIIDRSVAAAFDLFAANMDISRESFADVQGFRRLIEVGIGDQLMLSLNDADLLALEALNGAMRDADEVADAAELDFRFHRHLVGMAGNHTLAATYQFLKPVVMRLMMLGKSRRPAIRDTYDDHAGIIAALRQRDRIAFAYLMSRHLEFGARFLDAPDPAADNTGDAATSNNYAGAKQP